MPIFYFAVGQTNPETFPTAALQQAAVAAIAGEAEALTDTQAGKDTQA